jgi:hypothetical protein
MHSFQKFTLALLIVIAGITVASAAPERMLRDQSGILHAQDQWGTWRSMERQPRAPIVTPRTPIVTPRAPVLPFTLEEERAFERASQPTTG